MRASQNPLEYPTKHILRHGELHGGARELYVCCLYIDAGCAFKDLWEGQLQVSRGRELAESTKQSV